ncbi:DNA-binding dual transcriptional regulator OmpR [Paraburkholderia unamae]|uniref:response regulator n=1 Tax=Paraburkholderia unamae TaxID=219649 RepID=UPI001CB5DD57|nr:response regulator transcription factor [Paraburkholderia unamae]CAG9266280.1 DNA-binding dual transcriptional regulator OmpR [Paraburkholderia unamae]
MMEKRLKILIVEDDAAISGLLSESLRGFGMQADEAPSGAAMQEALSRSDYDLIVLDLMLPDADGVALCRKLRQSSDVPIIILTARGEPMERVVGLEVGADDYVVKPFTPRELVARIHAIMRRARGGKPEGAAGVVAFANWKLNLTARHLVADDGTVVPLSNAEFRLLNVFLAEPGRVLSREYLMDASHGRATDVFDRSIDVQISRLRQRLGDDVKDPRLIRTIRGEGYMFDPVTR